jgi:hypothetical protein
MLRMNVSTNEEIMMLLYESTNFMMNAYAILSPRPEDFTAPAMRYAPITRYMVGPVHEANTVPDGAQPVTMRSPR